MFDTKKFGRYLSALRKNADMTQSELADKLDLTRQAISRYELGDSFPDISILVLISDIFKITLDELINSGSPTQGENFILKNIAVRNNEIIPENADDVISLAPLIKPSILFELSEKFAKNGIDITAILELSKYLSDKNLSLLIESADFSNAETEFIEKLLPLLDSDSKYAVFEKIIEGEIPIYMIRSLLPYAEFLISHIEAAVLEGALPKETLKFINEYQNL